jgi:hypothetical protein
MRVSSVFEDLFTGGFPKRRRSLEEERYQQWRKIRWYVFYEAVDSLRLVREYEDSRQAEVKEK